MQSTRIGKYEIWYENSEEFYELKKEIFGEHRYYLEVGCENPRIVDLGSHIGMTVIYFKTVYPDSTIVAYEPEASNYVLLEKNVRENQLTRVTIFNQAVAPKSGSVELQIPTQAGWKSGSGIITGGWKGVQKTAPRRVEAVGINEVLQHRVDLLKMDIEGMEYEVLGGADLTRVQNLIVEVHPRSGKREEVISRKLQQNGMRVEREVDKSRYGSGLIIITGRRD